MIRSIQIIPAIAKESSGPTYSVTRLAESLTSIGCQTTIAALDWPGSPSEKDGLSLFKLGYGNPRWGSSPAMLRWLRQQCKMQNTQQRLILHSHSTWQLNSLYPAIATLGTNTKFVYSPRGSMSSWAMKSGSALKRIFWPLLQRPANTRAACFHATSGAELEDIKRMGFRQPVALIPNGIDLPVVRSAGPKKKEVLFLGRIHPVKGVELLIKSWSQVEAQFQDWSLRIVGSDDGYYGKSGYMEYLKRETAEMGCKRCKFAGELQGPDKWRALSEASILVLPSQSENFGLVVAESLASGTPAIVTKGAPWGGLERERSGWWVEYNEAQLATALRNAMSCAPDELVAMGERGRRWMANEYSWGRVSRSMLDLYGWLNGETEKPFYVVE